MWTMNQIAKISEFRQIVVKFDHRSAIRRADYPLTALIMWHELASSVVGRFHASYYNGRGIYWVKGLFKMF